MGLPLPLLEEREMESVALFLFTFFLTLPLMGSVVQKTKMFTAAAACDSLWRGRRMTLNAL